MVLEVSDSSNHRIGEIIYGVPEHICPTVALYDKAKAAISEEEISEWEITARNRTINH
jgi:hypothetical protein